MKWILLFLLLSAQCFGAISISGIHTANNNLIVVQLDADTTDEDSIPIRTGWTINGGAPDSIGRYTFVRDEDVDYTSGTVYLVYVSHRMYLRMTDSLMNDSSYIIASPYGTDTLVYTDKGTWNESIKVNQVGYPTKARNRYANFGVFAGDMFHEYLDTLAPPSFYVMDTSTKEIVYTGTSTFLKADTLIPDSSTSENAGSWGSGEYVFRMNLDTIPPGGPYYVVMPGFGRSHPFGIGDDYVRTYHRTLARGMYHQRCGIALDKRYTDYTRGKCHNYASLTDWVTWGSSTFITITAGADTFSVRGGYHDAGDYDRRPMHTIMPLAMMSYYEAFQNNFIDSQYSIPESGNGIPDFLDEALWGMLIWYYLQVTPSNFPDSTTWWGSVFQGLETTGHPGYGVSDGRADLNSDGYGNFVPNRATTADACGLFAQAARLIEPYDSIRADSLSARALMAWDWLIANDTSQVESPFMYCALQMYLNTVTGDSATDYNNTYHAAFRARVAEYITAGGVYPDQFLMGNLSADISASHFASYLLTTATTDSTTYAELYDALKTATDNGGYMGWTPTAGYAYAQGVTKFNSWGASTAQGRYSDGAAYMLAISTTDSAKQHYYDYVAELANFAVGLNPQGQSYVTGLGSVQPQSPLHLDSYWPKHGKRPGSNYSSTDYGNVPGIVVYGPTWGRSGADYQYRITDHLWPCFDYTTRGGVCSWEIEMPGLRRWTDGWGAVNQNEFTTWETMVWNVVMTAALYDASPDTLGAGQSTSALNIGIDSYLTGYGDTSTYVTLDANFPADSAIIFNIVNFNDSLLLADTVTVQQSQTRYTFNVTGKPAGTHFLKVNGLVTGTFTKE